MNPRKSDVSALLGMAKAQLETLEKHYQQALQHKQIPVTLAVEVKNYLENLRAPLDYIAKEVAESVLGRPNLKSYFPMSTENEAAFVSHMNRNFPGLSDASQDLYYALKSLQCYQPSGLKNLPVLSKLVNENKHNQLTPQVREENRGLSIVFPGGASISMGPGCSISGGGVISSGGAWFSPGGGSVSGDSPARHGSGFQQTVQVWVSFKFSALNREVMSVLQDCYRDVHRAVDSIGPLVWN